jgi:hypothetical protein
MLLLHRDNVWQQYSEITAYDSKTSEEGRQRGIEAPKMVFVPFTPLPSRFALLCAIFSAILVLLCHLQSLMKPSAAPVTLAVGSAISVKVCSETSRSLLWSIALYITRMYWYFYM